MTIKKLYDRVSRRTDTSGTKINVAETSRVLACYFDELSRLSPADVAKIQARGLELASQRRRRSK